MTNMILGAADARAARGSCRRTVEIGRPIDILVVEDNAADTRLTIETLREDRILNTLSVVTDGELALRYLRRQPPYTQVARPDLVLIDLTLPRRNGPELLAELQADAELRSIPVALLTASIVDQELLLQSHIQADFYLRKPVDLWQLMGIVGQVERFGISIVAVRHKADSENERR